MRYLVAISLAALVAAQDSTRTLATYTYDVHGRRVLAATAGSSTGSGGSFRAETLQSVNGRTVPLEAVEEKVISEGPEGKVIERLVRRYDANGRPGQSEKIRIEERKDTSGTMTVVTTVYDSDLNGRYALRERGTARTAKSGEVVQLETVIERPNLSGALDLFEKRQGVQTGTADNQLTEVTVYRRDTNGGLLQAERLTSQTVVENGQTTQTSATYNTNSTGKLELADQRISKIQKNPDGSEVEVVSIYGGNLPARAADGYSKGAALREQQIIERKLGPGDSLVETFSVRRPNLESGTLGPVQKISETVCTGKCQPEPEKK